MNKATPAPPRKAFGTYDIARICLVTPATVGRWIEEGKMPAFTTGGGHRRVWAEDLAAFLKAHNFPLPAGLADAAPLRVLIVDDEDNVRRMLVRTLRRLYPEADVQEAADGFEAGQKITAASPHLVLLDLNMPGMDGYKICRLIRADPATRHIKILVISGQEVEESRAKSLGTGADDFLAKPFDSQALSLRLKALLEKTR